MVSLFKAVREPFRGSRAYLACLPFILVVSCAGMSAGKDSPGARNVNTQNCTATVSEDSQTPPEREFIVCVVFSDADPDPANYALGCPIFTVFGGQPNGMPNLSGQYTGNQKILWQAVRLDPNGQYTNLSDVHFKVVFDPFVTGPSVETGQGNNAGSALSPPIKCKDNARGCIRGVDYKYTIQKEIRGSGNQVDPDPACQPLDPVFRVDP